MHCRRSGDNSGDARVGDCCCVRRDMPGRWQNAEEGLEVAQRPEMQQLHSLGHLLEGGCPCLLGK